MKRFYTDVMTVEVEDGFGVTLDGRRIRTPLKRAVSLPTRRLAHALAQEWEAQQDVVDLKTMGINRLVNIAIDEVMPDPARLASEISAYGGSDLVCYRADAPDELVQRQAGAWDPLLAWAAEEFALQLTVTTGVMPVAQDGDSLTRLSREVAAFDAFTLGAMRDVVGICGSLVIGLALHARFLDIDAAWAAAQIDEDWQIEKWGEDSEAMARRANAFAALQHADHLLRLLND